VKLIEASSRVVSSKMTVSYARESKKTSASPLGHNWIAENTDSLMEVELANKGVNVRV
jgi:hypothetical protein